MAKKERDGDFFWMVLLSIILPLLGLIIYFACKKEDKEKAKYILTGTIAGVILFILFFIVLPIHKTKRVGTCYTFGPDYRTVKDTYKDKDGKEHITWCCCRGKKEICSEDNECVIVKEKNNE